MGKGYLLDTNTIIYYLEGVLTPIGKEFVKESILNGAKISIISKIELLAWNPPQGTNIDNLNIFLNAATIYDLNTSVADKTIYIRKTYRKVKLPDAIIAATCICLDLNLVSRNTADFSLIKELEVIDPFQVRNA